MPRYKQYWVADRERVLQPRAGVANPVFETRVFLTPAI